MSNMGDVAGLRAVWKELAESEYEFEPATGTLWGYMRQRGNPCFNLALLKDIRAVGNELTANSGHIEFEGAMHKVNTYVAASRVPGVFNLGGDLAPPQNGDRELVVLAAARLGSTRLIDNLEF